MELILTRQNFYPASRTTKSMGDHFTYRTEMYLQQREGQRVSRSPSAMTTTWKNLKHQKRMFDDDQAEIDRVLSTIDSIHDTFNRSLSIPCNEVYSFLYGDDDVSIHLMRTFCQRQDHYINCDLAMKNNEDNNTRDTSSSAFANFLDTDADSIGSENEEEEENEYEKKKSCDSGYGSAMPFR